MLIKKLIEGQSYVDSQSHKTDNNLKVFVKNEILNKCKNNFTDMYNIPIFNIKNKIKNNEQNEQLSSINEYTEKNNHLSSINEYTEKNNNLSSIEENVVQSDSLSSKTEKIENHHVIINGLNQVKKRKNLIIKNIPSLEKIMIPIQIEEKIILGEADSGSPVSIISYNKLKEIKDLNIKKLPNFKDNFQLKGVTGCKLKIIHKKIIKMKLKNDKIYDIKVHITSNKNIMLLGRNFLAKTKCNLIYDKNKKQHIPMFEESENQTFIANQKSINFSPFETKNVHFVSKYKKDSNKYRILNNKNLLVYIDESKDLISNAIKLKIKNRTNKKLTFEEKEIKFTCNKICIPTENQHHDELEQHAHQHDDPDCCDPCVQYHDKYEPQVLDHDTCDNEQQDHVEQAVGINHQLPDQLLTHQSQSPCHQFDEKFDLPNAEKIQPQAHQVIDNTQVYQMCQDELNLLSPEKVNDALTGLDGICMEDLTNEKYTKENIQEQLLGQSEKVIENIIDFLYSSQSYAKSQWDLGDCKKYMGLKLKEGTTLPKCTIVYPLYDLQFLQLKDMLDLLENLNILEKNPDHGAIFGSPVFLQARKNKIDKGYRLLIDMRLLNSLLDVQYAAVIPSTFETLLACIPNTRFISSVDINNCYYSIKLDERTIKSNLTNINTPFGSYRLLRMITGCNASPSFLYTYIYQYIQYNLQGEFSPFKSILLIFYDDLSLLSPKNMTFEEHMTELKELITRLNFLGFKLNLKKSALGKDLYTESLDILGYLISYNKISVHPKQIKSILELSSPKCIKDLQCCTGILAFIRGIYDLNVHGNTGCLYDGLKSKGKRNEFIWTDEMEKAFQKIKINLSQKVQQVKIPSKNSINILFSDSSKYCIGGTLFNCNLDDYPELYEEINPKTTSLNNDLITTLQELKIKEEYKIIIESENILNLCTEICNILKIKKLDSMLETLFLGGILDLTYNQKIEYDMDQNIAQGLHLEHYRNDIRKYLYDNIGEEPMGMIAYLLHNLAVLSNYTISLIVSKTSDCRSFSTLIGPKQYDKNKIYIFYNYKKYYMINTENENRTKIIKNIDDIDEKAVLKYFFKCAKDVDFAERIDIVGNNSSPIDNTLITATSIAHLEFMALADNLEYFNKCLGNRITLCLIDNSAVYYNLRPKKAPKKSNRLDRIALKLAFSNTKKIKYMLIESNKNIADILTRLLPNNRTFDQILLDEDKFSVKTEFEDKDEGVKIYPLGQQIANISEEKKVAEEIIEEKFDITNFIKEQILEFGCVSDNLISVKYENDKILLPTKYQSYIILANHREAGHLGVERTKNVLLKNYKVVNNSSFIQLINNIINSCLICKLSKPNIHKHPSGSTFHNLVNAPHQLIHLDLFEYPITLKSGFQGAKSVLLICDNFSRFLTLYPIPNKKDESIILSLCNYFATFRPVFALSTDNAPCFKSNKISKYLSKLNIHRLYSGERLSRARGYIEVQVRKLQDMIRAKNIEDIDNPNVEILVTISLYAHIINNVPYNKRTSLTPNIVQNLDMDNKELFEVRYNMRTVTLKFTDEELEERIINKHKELRDEVINMKAEIMKARDEKLDKINKNKKGGKFKIFDYVMVKDTSPDNLFKQLRPKFQDQIYQVNEVGKHKLLLTNLYTKMVEKHPIPYCKKIPVYKNGALKLSKEVIKGCQIFQDPNDLPILKQKNKPTKRNTRQNKNEEDEIDFESTQSWIDNYNKEMDPTLKDIIELE